MIRSLSTCAKNLFLLSVLSLLFIGQVLAQAPTITSFSPASGAVGATVTITGTNFNATVANNIVFFGATKATVTAGSATSLTVTVPIGATYQNISVTDISAGLTAYSAKPFNVTYANGIISHQPKVDFAAGEEPRSIAIGDLDGDGKPDLAVANYGSNTISVYRNTTAPGSITTASFAAKVDFNTGNNPSTIAIGDLDGDGKPDLAVANHESHTLSVIRNTTAPGSITSASFAAKVDFATDYYPYTIAIGDLDGDGKPELAVTNSVSNSVSVLRNTTVSGRLNTASFAARVNFATGDAPISLAIGDLDGDGKSDLAVANYDSRTVSLLRNISANGSLTAASFAARVDFATGSNPWNIAIGDLDGDGKPDLALTDYGSDILFVYRNTSVSGSLTAASFAAKVNFNAGNGYAVSIGDLDGDGKPDLAVANSSSNSVSVLRNTSANGSLTEASFAAKVVFSSGSFPRSLAIGDLDGDGKPDLAVANANSFSLSVLRNSVLAPITQATNVNFTNTNATGTTATWTNGNGGNRAVFIAAATTGSPAAVNFTAYTANTTFGSGTQIGATGWYCVYNGTGTTVDVTGLNARTAYRIMVVEYNGTGSNVAYLNTVGTGNPATVSTLVPVPTITSFSPESGAVGATVTITGTNFNATAANNIVFFGATKATVTAGSATSLTVTVPIGATYQNISVTDISAGLTAYSAKPFSVTYANGIISHQPKVDFATGTGPRYVAIGDLDGDGKPDLAVANSTTVSVYHNTTAPGSITTASFAAKVDFPKGNGSSCIAIGDLDGDGKPDLAVTNSVSYRVSVYRNTTTPGSITTASFAVAVDFVTDASPNFVAIGDLDRDGKPDLAVTNGAGVSVYRNTAASGSLTTASFSAKVDFATGNAPYCVAIGDLDGDSKPDLVVTNVLSNNLSIFRNTATAGSLTAASFAAKVDFVTGNAPNSVAIGDLDGNGKPDLAVVNYNDNTLSIFRNTTTLGSITAASFAAKVDLNSVNSPYYLAIGDIDGDGKPELVVVNRASNAISVIRNSSTSGSITKAGFADKASFETDSNPFSVAIGDLDGDGKPDLAVANSLGGTVSVLRNSVLAPTTKATNVTFSNTTTTGTTATWTNGNGSSRAVFVAAASTDSPTAVDGTAYTANTTFASGDQIASTGWYCVYNGTGTIVNVTGLTEGTTYRLMVVEYNGIGSNVAYLNTTGTGNPANVSTIAIPAITSFSPASGAVGTTVTITGTGFNAIATNNIVFFGATKATVTAGSATSLTVTVPTGATYQNISVTDISAGLTAYAAKPFSVTYANGTISHQPKVNFATGTSPKSVAIGDLDGDDKPDLVVAYSSNKTISIYRNITAAGSLTEASFAEKVDFATGTSPESVAIGDLDGDGKPDLAVANSGTNNVSVYRNIATSGSITSASFATKVDFATSAIPSSIAIGDLDGDGKPDLAVANYGSNTVSVLRNTAANGSITAASFAAKIDFDTSVHPACVTIGDLDGDGKPDLAVTNINTNNLSVFRNTATLGSITTASFSAKVDFVTGINPRSLAICDLDGDGKPDLVVANTGNRTVSVLRNTSVNGSLTADSFTAKIDFAVGNNPYGVAIGDMDGDGKPDLAVANYGSNTVSVLRNTAVNGSLTAASFVAKADFATGVSPVNVAIGDLDGDGKPDLATANTNGKTLSVLRNSVLAPITQASNITFTTTTTTGTTATWTNGNGSSRAVFIAAASTDSPTAVDFAEYTANTTFGSGTQLGTTGWYCVYNGTGTIVNVTGLTEGTTYRLMVVEYNGIGSNVAYLNTTGTGNPANVSTIAIPAITSFSPASGAVGTTVTITGTGFNATATNNIVFFGATKATVTAGSATSLTVTVPFGATYQNISVINITARLIAYAAKPFNVTYANGTISHQPKVDFATGTTPKSVAIGDLDGDDKPDLVVANSDSRSISVYRNTTASGNLTTASFAEKVDFATGDSPYGVAIGDLDGDGKPELIVANSGTNNVSVLRNTAVNGSLTAASFEAKVNFATGVNPTSVAVGDLDDDGKPDLAVTNYESNTVSVLRNTSANGSLTAASFAAKIDFDTGVNPISIAIGDLDGDSKPDLVVANTASNNLSVFRNTATSGSLTMASFAAKVDFATGSNPRSVSIGELDGDGKPDLVTMNYFSNTVSVLRNTSANGSMTTASFAAKVDFSIGNSSLIVAIGDLDGDGKPDLTVANYFSNTVSVLRNTSAIGSLTAASFAIKRDFSTGGNPISVAIGDLDGDGKPDLVVANNGSNSLSVLRNSVLAPITQATNVTLTNTTKTGTTAIWTSGNGASRAVFIAAATTGSPVAVDFTAYTANTTFGSGTQIGATGWYCVYNGTGTTVDVTGLNARTAYRIMVVEYNGTGSNVAYLNTVGTGNPATVSTLVPVPTITSFSPESGAVGATVTITGTNFNATAANNIVFFGATKATVTAGSATSLTVTVPIGATYQNISVTDISAGLTAYSAKPFNVTYPNGTVSHLPKADFATGTSPYSVAIGDLDGDGKPDLAVANASDNTVSVYRNTTTSGNLTAASFDAKVNFDTGLRPISVAIGDLDGDGKPDLAVANSFNNSVSVYRNTAAPGGITTASFDAKVDFDTGGSASFIAIGDLDGDGKPDLAVTNTNSRTVSVYRNNTTPGSITSASFDAKVDFNTGVAPGIIAIGDLDGDGKPDFAVVNSGSRTISVYRNTSVPGRLTASSFAANVNFTSDEPYGLAIADLDGDGKPDLAATNTRNNTVSVYRNTAVLGSLTAASFMTKVDFTTGDTPFSISIGDLDGDGKPDLATANYSSSTVSVLRNTSVNGSLTAASFAIKRDFSTGDNPYSVAIGDLDGDGKPDLVVANNGDNSISLLRNSVLAPTTQATNITFTNTTTTGTTATWTNGNGASRAVFMAAAATGSPVPVDLTGYTANTVFGSGTQLGTTGWYCVYNGIGTTVNVTGLTAGTTYRVMAVEYNGTGSNVAYLNTVGTGNPANVSPTIDVTSLGLPANAVYKTDDVLTFTVNTSAPVTVNTGGGIPYLPLVIGTGTVQATYTGGSGTSALTFSYTVQADDLDADGIALASAINLNGGTLANTEPALVTVNTSGIIVDGVKPTLIAKAVSPTSHLAKPGDQVGIVFTASEAISAPSVTIAGHAPTTLIGSGAGPYTAAYTMVASDAEGPIAMVIDFKDLAGNAGITVDLTNDANYTLAFDKTPPAIGIGTPSVAATNTGPVVYTVTYTDANSITLSNSDITLNKTGTANAAIINVSGTGGTRTVTLSGITGAGTLGIGIAAGTATDQAGNLALASSASGTFEVHIAQVITFAAIATKTYGDADYDPSASSTNNGIQINYTSDNTDVATVVNNKIHIKAVGTANITASQLADATHSAAENVVRQFTVNTKALTIIANHKTKNYGDELINETGSLAFTANGLANSETIGQVNIEYDDGKAVTASVAIYTTQIRPSQASGGTFNPANYNTTYANGNIVVTAIPLTVTAAAKSKTYGDVDPDLTYSITNGVLINGDTFSGSLIREAGDEVGTYLIKQGTLALNSNYTLTYEGANLSIGAKAITVTAAALSKTYGNVDPVLTYSITNGVLVNSDTFTGSLDRDQGDGVGTYLIKQGTLALNSNYTLTYEGANLSIGAKAITVTAAALSKTYGDVDPVLTYSITSGVLVNGDTFSGSLDREAGDEVGTYLIKQGTLALNSNYTLTYEGANLSIRTKALTIAADNKNKPYGAANPVLTATYTGFVNGDTNASLTTQPNLSTTATASSATGTYPITASGAVSANYNISYVAATLTVTNNILTISATNTSKTYGLANPTLLFTYSGFINGDTPASLTTLPNASTTATVASGVGTYPIIASGAVSNNYTLVYVPAVLTVNKAILNVSADNKSRSYGLANPALTLAYSGFLNGDTPASLTTPATAVTNATTASPPGSYDIIPSGAVSANYDFNYSRGTLKVVPLTSASLSNLTISSGQLSPVFSGNTYSYKASVIYAVNSITFTPTADANANITVNGVATANGSASAPIALNPGENTISVVVAAQDGLTKLTYIVTVHRALAADAIVATNILSPNGDGVNDNWVIKDIELYPGNKVTIFDVGGREVYSKMNYSNDWAGTVNSAPLTQGTYFYTIFLGPGYETLRGFITIVSVK